jgi:hypothetical protein
MNLAYKEHVLNRLKFKKKNIKGWFCQELKAKDLPYFDFFLCGA